MTANHDVKGGLDVLRAALRARRRSSAAIAHDCGVPAEAMHQFAHHQGPLPVPVLDKLTDQLFAGHLRYDHVLDVVRPTNENPPQPGPVHPPPFVPKKVNYVAGAPPPMQTGYGGPSKPKPKRVGWLSSW